MNPHEDPTERDYVKKRDKEFEAIKSATNDQIAVNMSGDAIGELIGIPAPRDPDLERDRFGFQCLNAENALRKQDYIEAIIILDDVLKKQPDYAEALWLRAAAHAGEEDYGAAVRDAEEAQRLDPNGHFPRCA